MPTLIRNVWIDGRYYGPDHGGDEAIPPDVAARIAPDAWHDTDRPAVDSPHRAELLARADKLGIDADRRWSTKRLASTVQRAEQQASE